MPKPDEYPFEPQEVENTTPGGEVEEEISDDYLDITGDESPVDDE